MLSEYMIKRRNIQLGLREPDPKKQLQPIKKVSDKKKKEIQESKELQLLDKNFYLEVWAALPHRCIQCGCNLGKEAQTIFFHHLLPKSKYPEFRHTPENIAIVCPADHSKAETNIDTVPKIKSLRDRVLKLLLK